MSSLRTTGDGDDDESNEAGDDGDNQSEDGPDSDGDSLPPMADEAFSGKRRERQQQAGEFIAETRTLPAVSVCHRGSKAPRTSFSHTKDSDSFGA